MEKDLVFKSSQILHSVSGISFLLLHNLFNFLVPQKMVNKALQRLLSNLQHGKFNWQMQLPWFLSCSLICAALPNLFSGSLRSLRIFFLNNNNNHFYQRKFTSPPPPLLSFAGVRTCGRCPCISLVDLSMKFTTSCFSSSHIIGVAILSSELLNRIIHNKVNYSCTICV